MAKELSEREKSLCDDIAATRDEIKKLEAQIYESSINGGALVRLAILRRRLARLVKELRNA